jgi:glycerate 2-kinase
MNHREIAEDIFKAGIQSVLPEGLISKVMTLEDNHLILCGQSFDLDTIQNIFIIGAGKACAMMAYGVEKILGSRITEGHIIVKHGYSYKLKYINVTEAGHPVPDSHGFKATKEIVKIASKANEKDLVICLLSGGGSSLLADIPEGSSPREMIIVNDLLVNSGAGIHEINAVRKHLSLVKGGQLAKDVYPATLVSLILSDVPGDHLDVIASGPTTPDTTTFQQALEVLDSYNLTASAPRPILKYLRDGISGSRPETPKPSDNIFKLTSNYLIGTNLIALEAAKQKALEFNINPVIIDDKIQGDNASVAEYIVETALKFLDDINEVKPVCLLFGGETTLKMKGRGIGGRNQHLALLCAVQLQDHPGITILSAGTDGTDGPTDAAGAVVDSDTIPDAIAKSYNPERYIREFDSYHFFKKVGGHIITGPTMTNVMDIIVAIVDESKSV